MPLNPDSSVKLLIDRLKTLSENDAANAERVKALEEELVSVRVETREEIDRLLLHTHQVQESLEQVFQNDQAKQKQIKELEKEKEERDASAEERDALAELVMTLESELSELSSLLHKMQEELEHQFLSNKKQKDMLDTYASQEDRFQNILHKILHAPAPKNTFEAKE